MCIFRWQLQQPLANLETGILSWYGKDDFILCIYIANMLISAFILTRQFLECAHTSIWLQSEASSPGAWHTALERLALFCCSLQWGGHHISTALTVLCLTPLQKESNPHLGEWGLGVRTFSARQCRMCRWLRFLVWWWFLVPVVYRSSYWSIIVSHIFANTVVWRKTITCYIEKQNGIYAQQDLLQHSAFFRPGASVNDFKWHAIW